MCAPDGTVIHPIYTQEPAERTKLCSSHNQVPTNGGGQGPDVGGVTLPTGFTDGGGTTAAGAAAVGIGIGLNGDTALTDTTGTFAFSDINGDSLFMGAVGASGIYGDTGIQCSQTVVGCDSGGSNNNYSSTATFPNTTPLAVGNGLVGDPTGMVLDPLRAEMTAASAAIAGFGSSGTLTSQTLLMDWYIKLDNPGLHVIDVINPNGVNLDLGDFDIVIDGVADSSVIFRVPDETNVETSNSFIGIGTRGIGLNNVLFYTDQANEDTHFNLQNLVVNGVAFWDFSDFNGSAEGPPLNVSNAQGCAQFIGGRIDLQNVRFNNCFFGGTGPGTPGPGPGPGTPGPGTGAVSEPSSVLLFGLAMGAWARYTQRRRRR